MAYHIKLLRSVRFKGLTQFVTLPVGRCLENRSEGDTTWVAEIEEGEGHFTFNKADPNIVEATTDDLVSEPDYNGYESFD